MASGQKTFLNNESVSMKMVGSVTVDNRRKVKSRKYVTDVEGKSFTRKFILFIILPLVSCLVVGIKFMP